MYKYAREWELSLEQNRRATTLDPQDQAGWWNLGIAATALGNWSVARSAWRGAGIAVPDGDGAIDYPCGRAPIRLNPDADAEVVWAERLDPARAKLQNIPLAESGFRFADVVLNDGAATGWRKLNDREVPVFNCLQLLQASQFSTWVADVELGGAHAAEPDALDALTELALDRDLAAEDWSSSIQLLCKACSEGKPYSDHEHPPEELGSRRRVAIASPSAHLTQQLLEDWRGSMSGVTIATCEIALDAAV